MSEVTVTLSNEQVDELLKNELSRDYAQLRIHKAQRQDGEGFPFESQDPEEDANVLSQLCWAFEQVLEYYGIEK